MYIIDSIMSIHFMVCIIIPTSHHFINMYINPIVPHVIRQHDIKGKIHHKYNGFNLHNISINMGFKGVNMHI